MKRLILSFALIIAFAVAIFAQAPNSFKYQAVARDAMGQVIQNQVIGLRFSLIEGNVSGNSVYSEVHYPTTSDLGVFSLEVGKGIIQGGSMTNADWGNMNYWLRVELDPTGGNNFQLMGISQLLSVPYALHAGTVENADDADADPTNEIQALSFNSATNILTLTGGGQVDLSSLVGGSGGSDDQNLSLNGTILSIEDGNSINLNVLQDGVNDADADPQNELQSISFNSNTNTLILSNGGQVDLGSLAGGSGGTDDQNLSLNGTTLSIENGNSVDLSSVQDGVNDADSNPTNELQNLTLANTMLMISNGNSVDLSVIQDGVNDADADPMNEIQTLSFNSNTNELSIANGNTITIPSGGTDADPDPTNELQTISKNGNTVSLSHNGGTFTDEVNDADADATNELQNLSLTGTQIQISGGNSVDLAPIIPPGGTDDQNLTLNGTNLTIENGNTIDLSVVQDGVNDADADPTNEFQNLTLNGTEVQISNGNSIDLAPIIPPGGTDDQTLTLSGTNLTIEDGNSIDLSVIQDGVDDADNDPVNELQTVIKSGNLVTLTQGGGSFTDEVEDADADATNELQTISKSGYTITLSNGGGSILDEVDDLDADPGNELQILSLNGTVLDISGVSSAVDLVAIQDGVDDADNNPTNELQNLTLNGNDLSISGGNTVDLSGVGSSSLWTANSSDIYFNSGKVGIGTTTPTYDLTLSGGGQKRMLINSEGNNDAYLKLATDDGFYSYFDIGLFDVNLVDFWSDGTTKSGASFLEAGSTTGKMVLNSEGGPMHLMTGGNTRIFMGLNGNVGFGTVNPVSGFQFGEEPRFNVGLSFGSDPTLDHWVIDQSQNTGLSFWTGSNGSHTAKVTFSKDGEIGLNTIGPLADLHIMGDNEVIRLEGSDPLIGFYDQGTYTAYIREASNSDYGLELGTAFGSNKGIDFSLNGLTRMVLKNDNLGIGTTNPTQRLHVMGDMILEDGTPGLNFYNNGTWMGYFYHDQTDMIMGNIYTNSILFQTNALTRAEINSEGLELNNADYQLDFENTTTTGPIIKANYNGSATGLRVATTGFAISESGTVNSGDYPFRLVQPSTYGLNIFNGSTEDDWELYVANNGNLELYYNNNIFMGAFSATNGTYTPASDERLKTNVQSLPTVLNDVLELQPSVYKYKTNKESDSNSIGFIAQEVRKVFPELVNEISGKNSDTLYAVDYAGFSVVAVKAIQEQQEIIEKQNEKIEDLEARLARLEALISKK